MLRSELLKFSPQMFSQEKRHEELINSAALLQSIDYYVKCAHIHIFDFHQEKMAGGMTVFTAFQPTSSPTSSASPSSSSPASAPSVTSTEGRPLTLHTGHLVVVVSPFPLILLTVPVCGEMTHIPVSKLSTAK